MENNGSNTASTHQSFDDINYEGLMYDQYSVWRMDSVNPLSSYESKYDAKAQKSSQTCTAYRSVQDSTNFILKQGKTFTISQGYRIYEDVTSLAAKFSGDSDNIQAQFVESTEAMALFKLPGLMQIATNGAILALLLLSA